MFSTELLQVLSKRELSAADALKIAGVSYRRLAVWDSRNYLPRGRASQRAWRRFTALDLLHLRIVAAVRDQFGISPSRLEHLALWLQGRRPDLVRLCMRSFAEDVLFGYSWSDFDLHGRLRGAIGDGAVKCDARRLPREAPRDVREHRDGRVLTHLLVDKLVERGWTSDDALDFVLPFLSLTFGGWPGHRGALPTLDQLDAAASNANDEIAREAVSVLTYANAPLLAAINSLECGLAVRLVSDLRETHAIVDEATFADDLHGVWPDHAKILRNMGGVNKRVLREAAAIEQFPTFLVVPLEGHINAMLRAVGHPGLQVTMPGRASANSAATPSQEQKIIDLIRARDFVELIVVPRGGGFHVRIAREHDASEVKRLPALVRNHAYQSITLRRVNGQIVRVVQEVSLQV